MNRLVYSSLCAMALAGGAQAGVSLEFNAAEAAQSACRISVLARGDETTTIMRAAFEAAVFDKEGVVSRMALLDLGELPAGSARVRQFEVPELACDALGQIQITRTVACEGGEGLCESARVTSRLWESAPLEAGIGLELNRIDPTETGCRLTFVTRNGTEEALGALGAETVFFDKNGAVANLSVFQLGDVAAGESRVRRYELAGQSCESLGQVLLNGVGAGTALPKFTTKTELDLLQ